MINSIVQILSGTKIAGAGFLASRNGLVVSCAHVILNAGTKPGGFVNIRFINDKDKIYSASVLEHGWRESSGDDIAFLEILGEFPEVEPLLLGSSERSFGHDFRSFGFPEMRDEMGVSLFTGVWAEGKIIGHVNRNGGQRVIQLSSFELDRGFSGAPVLDEKTNHIIGIVTDAQQINPLKKQQLLAWATPSENIVAANPNLYFSPSSDDENLLTPIKLPVNMAHSLARADYFSGRKSYLKAIQSFWDDDRTGTFALVGIGGAGKTAIVRYFLEESGWLESDKSNNSPDGLFVWSFYDNQDTTKFVTEAYKYFAQGLKETNPEILLPDGENANVFRLADILQKTNGRHLIIMDGLEKMQSEGRGPALPRGTLIDPTLRHLLTRITDGVCGRTKAVVTSRFSLSDLSEWPGNKYIELDVNELEPSAARRLLKKLGVHGTTISLNLLASEYGRHALTLDLLGRLISEYANGQPERIAELPFLELAEGSDKVERQAARLARVLRFYESRLTDVQLKIIELLCAFRWPVEFEFFRDLLTGDNGAKLSVTLSDLTPNKLQVYLHKLGELRLLTMEKNGGTEFYTTHPAIRDHFYIRLTNQKEAHEAIRSQLATLMDAPGYIKPKDTRAIELIEELVYHTIKTGKVTDAFNVYRNNLGYRHLGWELGAHARGVGMMRLFEERQVGEQGDINQSQLEILTIDNGLYLKNLGLLDQAIDYMSRIVSVVLDKDSNLENRASAYQNLSAVQVLRGKLIDAEASARIAVDLSLKTSDERLVQDCRVRLGTAFALRGNASEAEIIFGEVKKILTKDRQKSIPRDWPGIRHGWLLMRLGKLDDAEKELDETRDLSEFFGYPIITARSNIILAEVAFKQREIHKVRAYLDKVNTWASRAFDQEMVVATNLVAAKTALEFGDYSQTKRYLYDGLRVAEESGHSIYWIDLKVVQGYMQLKLKDLDNAKNSAQYALDGMKGRAGRPDLLGARSLGCGYEWGKADALQLLAEVQLEAEDLLLARPNLDAALSIRSNLHDPSIENTKLILERKYHD